MTFAGRTSMPKTYDPSTTEGRLYAFWEERGYFEPDAGEEKEPFVISIPPPNITGELHYGHAMFVTFQDVMIRWNRMLGRPTLWLPGTDHAAIATQNVVEQQLAEEGLTRYDLGRERFLERFWEWKERYEGIITHQLRRLGASCDWSRERFTLDEGLSRAVREAFVQLYRKGLIYRGPYLVNWCPRCGTAISDLEVDHQEEMASLYYVRYRLEDGGSIEVATTRPETILGDTAVAVNPQDERFQDLVGKLVILPILKRRIPVIADEVVDMEFGTGAVKVTPGHDPNDYEIGLRHGLPTVNIMRPDARMNENAGPYRGMDRYACRQALLTDLEREGLLVRVEEHHHAIGRCQRCHTVVEPLISEQWFVRIKPLADPAIGVVRQGRIEIIPERFAKVYYNWMENIRDWCISRQLWLGHRIPVWYCDSCGELTVQSEEPSCCGHCGSASLRQDPDVLDTWFSSALWPFSTLGWPDETEDLARFYPTTVMETAYDILFFWVARMIMMGLECTGEVPFRVVYLHGIMRDEKGEKMSKSKGNVADPLDAVREYGADALRFAIATGSTPGNDTKLSLERVEAARNFANKIWNAARFVIGNLDGDEEALEQPEPGALTLADRWILSRLNRLTSEVHRLFSQYQFGEAGRQIYEFLWGEYCDWYIEIAKLSVYGDDEVAKQTTRQVLVRVLDAALRLLHPFMPFVTEEVWQHLPHRGDSIMVAPLPEAGERDLVAEREMELVMELVRAIRNARSEYRVDPARYIAAQIAAGERLGLLEGQAHIISALARVAPEELRMAASLPEKPRPAVSLVLREGIEVYLPLAEMVELAREEARLRDELEGVAASIERSQAKLATHGFLTKAPAQIVQRERERLEELMERSERLEGQLGAITCGS